MRKMFQSKRKLSILLLTSSIIFLLVFTNPVVGKVTENYTQGVVDVGETVELTYWLSTGDFYDEGGDPVEGQSPNSFETEAGVGNLLPTFDQALIGMRVGEANSKKVIVPASEHQGIPNYAQFEGQDLYFKIRIDAILDDDSATSPSNSEEPSTGSPIDWNELNLENVILPLGVIGGLVIVGILVLIRSATTPKNIEKINLDTQLSHKKQQTELSNIEKQLKKQTGKKGTSDQKSKRKLRRR